MKPTDFLDTAHDLLRAGRRRPRQTNLRRACSSLNYALFHTLCDCCATTLVGVGTQRAWQQAYRFIDHKPTKNRCLAIRNMRGFPPAIEDFADLFVSLQDKRHSADYSPAGTFYKSSVEADLIAARAAIAAFNNAKLKDRRAFAAHIALARSR